MTVFKKRETLTENMTYMAMMAAINVIFSLFAAWIPLGAIFVMIALPLTSAVIAIYCKPKYYAIYLLATIGVCLAATAWDMKNTLFYVIPSIFTGLAYGVLRKTKVPVSIIVFLVTGLQMLITYGSIWLIQWIYEVNMVSFIEELLGVAGSPLMINIVPAAMFAYALGQTGLSHLFMTGELSHLNQQEAEDNWISWVYPIIGIVFGVASFALSFWEQILGYVFLITTLYWSCFSVASLFNPRAPIVVYIVGGVLLLGSFFAFAGCYSLLAEGQGLILLDLPLVSGCIAALLNKILKKPATKVE
jgi:hypothetical protein